MELFENRTDAGKQLAEALKRYQDSPDGIVLGLARGGVPVAYEVARKLGLPLDVLCPRKVGAPMNPEFAIGAITESGEGIFDEETIRRLGIPEEYLNAEVAREREKAKRRIEAYRKGGAPLNLEGKTVILVDDGLATGATMKAAIKSARSQGAAQIVAAFPVSPLETLREIEELADDLECLETPPFFQAVGQFYRDFSATTDQEVIDLLHRGDEKTS